MKSNFKTILTFAFLFVTHAQFAKADDLALYVTNSNDNSVSVIDLSSDATVTTTLTVGTFPIGVAANPDGSSVYVANTGDDTLSVIDTSDNTVSGTVTVGDFPETLIFNSDGSKLYVVNNLGGTVSVINTSDNSVSATITVGIAPVGAAISDDDSTLYVVNSADGTVSVIDTSSNTVSATITLGTTDPQYVTATHAGDALYVSNFFDETITKVILSDNSVGTSFATGDQPWGLLISSDDSTIYSIDAGDSIIKFTSTSDLTTVHSVTTGSTPLQAVLSTDGSKLYVTESDADTLGIIDTSALTRTAVAVGDYPNGVALLTSPAVADPAELTLTSDGSYYAYWSETTDLVGTLENTGGSAAEDTQVVFDLSSSYSTFSGTTVTVKEFDDSDALIATPTYTKDDTSSDDNVIFNIGTVSAGHTYAISYSLLSPSSSDVGVGYTDSYTITATSGDITASSTLSPTYINDPTLLNESTGGCALNQNDSAATRPSFQWGVFFLSLILLPLLAMRRNLKRQ